MTATSSVGDARTRLQHGLPVTPRRLDMPAVSTYLLEGGTGPPVVLLHGQGGFAEMWAPVLRGLVPNHRVIAPDLPGLGGSTLDSDPLEPDAVLAWVGSLIDRTCTAPPLLVGHSLGGSIAARFAAEHSDLLAGLVLVDASGLAGRVRPAPGVIRAMIRHNVRPSERTARRLFGRLAADIEQLQRRLDWEPFLAYVLDRARTASVKRANQRLLRKLGMPGIPPRDLARIGAPTTMIWGRHDRVVPLRAAEQVSTRHGWPLHVIDDSGHLPHVEQPDAVLRVLRSELGGPPR